MVWVGSVHAWTGQYCVGAVHAGEGVQGQCWYGQGQCGYEWVGPALMWVGSVLVWAESMLV